MWRKLGTIIKKKRQVAKKWMWMIYVLLLLLLSSVVLKCVRGMKSICEYTYVRECGRGRRGKGKGK